jgi:hypothetical protein
VVLRSRAAAILGRRAARQIQCKRHSAFIGTETISLVVYTGKPDEILSRSARPCAHGAGASADRFPEQAFEDVGDCIAPQAGAAIERELHIRWARKVRDGGIEDRHAELDVPR